MSWWNLNESIDFALNMTSLIAKLCNDNGLEGYLFSQKFNVTIVANHLIMNHKLSLSERLQKSGFIIYIMRICECVVMCVCVCVYMWVRVWSYGYMCVIVCMWVYVYVCCLYMYEAVCDRARVRA